MPVAGQHRVKHWEATQNFHRWLPPAMLNLEARSAP